LYLSLRFIKQPTKTSPSFH